MKGTLSSRVIISFLLLLIVSAWLGWLTYSNNQVQLNSNELVSHSGEVLLNSEKLFNRLLNLETSERGYLQTGYQQYLEPYIQYRDSIDYYFLQLRSLTEDNEKQQQLLNKLQPIMNKHLELTDKAIKNGLSNLDRELMLATSLVQKETMDQIRSVVYELQQQEQQLLKARKLNHTEDTVAYNRIYLVTVIFFCILLTSLLVLIYSSLKATKESEIKVKKEAEIAREAQILLQSSLESLHEVLIVSVDVTYCIINFNTTFRDATYQAYGTTVEVGKNILDCITTSEDRAKSKENFDKALAGESHVKVEEYGDMERMYFETRYNLMRNDQGEILGVTVLTTDITARIKNDAELKRLTALARQAQILLQASLESLEGVIFVSIDQHYQYLNFNTNYQSMMLTHYDSNTSVGSNMLECITTHDDRQTTKVFFDRALSGESFISLEYYGENKRIYETRFNPIYDDQKLIIGASAFSSDITERIRSEKRINEMAAVVASSDDAILSKTLEGNIITWNRGAEKIFGYTSEEVIGKHISLLIPKQHLDEETYIINRIKQGRLIRNFETFRERKDGTCIPVSLTISPIKDKEGNITSIAKIARDITEQKKSEERIKAIHANLEEAKLAAELANRTKSQFLANMSHEIRTPLNAVIGLSHLVLKTDLTPKQIDYLHKIQSSSESLLVIINDILDFSKIESGKLILEEVSFDLEEIFQKLANVITYKANAKGLEIAFGINSLVPTFLIGDPGRLEQILVNLCSNAVKFTHAGDVVVTVDVKEDTSDKICLKFEVTDTGIGMDEVQMSRLFEPFTQADDTISRKYGGTGLGLSIIKRLVELMGGTVSVHSEPGKGSRFHFNLWLKKQNHQRKIPVPSIDLRKLNVLLVDDSKPALRIMQGALESLSFNVIAVRSGIQAIHYLKNNFHHNPIRLALIDWKMADMDGIETVKIIRQDEQFADVKIIMMTTSYANEVLYENADEVGISGILIKPIRYSKLYDLIIRALGKNEESRQLAERTKQASNLDMNETYRGHLLLVEDNEINQQVAGELLEGFGFTIEIADNGQKALDLVKNSGTPSRFNLVLMDLQMPVMGGRMATQEIRKIEAYQNLPIIAMTADAMQKVQDECFEVGMNDFITKPINPNKMLETIVMWLGSNSIVTIPATDQGSLKEFSGLYGIDIQNGLSYLGNNVKLFRSMLLKFNESNDRFQFEFLKAYREGNTVIARRMIHSMKGVSGTLGMSKLHDHCKQLEKVLLDPGSGNVESLINSLSGELNLIIESIEKNFIDDHPRAMVTDLDTALPQLIELENLLLDKNPDAVDFLNGIGMIVGFEEEMKNLNRVLGRYDFTAALNLLKPLQQAVSNLKT